MNAEDKEALREFLTGAALVVGVVAVAAAVVVFLGMGGGKSGDSQFEVVGTYDGCDVVRYTPWKVSEYKYFLRCKP